MICRIFTQYAGGPHTDAAEALYEEVYGPYLGDRYATRQEQSNRFMYSVPNFAMLNGVENFKEHTCRSFWDVPYEPGLKQSRGNNPAWLDTETPRTYYSRIENKTSHQVYKQHLVGIAGYRVRAGENGAGLRDHPMSDLTTDMLGYFNNHIKHYYLHIPKNMVAALTLELDTAMAVADATEEPAQDNVEDLENRIYGHRRGDDYFIKPWNNMAHHSAFFAQYNKIRGIIAGNTNEQPPNEDIVEIFKLLRFHILVQDFRPLFKEETDVSEGVFESRMRAYLTPS